MADANDPTPTPTPAPEPNDDASFYKAEAQKAFKSRDDLKIKLRDLEARSLSEEDRQLFDTLKDQAAKLEEDRQKKAGEFEALKVQLTDRQKQVQADHAKVLQDRDTKYSQLTNKFKDTVVRAEFGSAVDYFSGAESSKTILDVDLAMAYLGKFVHVEDTEDDAMGYRIVVKKPNGDTILGSDGNPAQFAEAIGELIKALPNRDRILRGSGKTGSGNSGGSTHAAKLADVTELTAKAQAGDKDAIAALKLRRRTSNAMQMGSAFTR